MKIKCINAGKISEARKPPHPMLIEGKIYEGEPRNNWRNYEIIGISPNPVVERFEIVIDENDYSVFN